MTDLERSPAPTLVGPRVTLRPFRPDDEAPIAAILAEPAVTAWWLHGGSAAGGAAELAVDAADPDVLAFAIEVDGRVVGYIQAVEEPTPEYRSCGIDLFLSTAAQGRGLGPEAIRVVARYLLEVRGHHRLTIDPALANEHAIRAYESVGFRRVGVMRRYERGADGAWRDALLLDLLVGELRG